MATIQYFYNEDVPLLGHMLGGGTLEYDTGASTVTVVEVHGAGNSGWQGDLRFTGNFSVGEPNTVPSGTFTKLEIIGPGGLTDIEITGVFGTLDMFLAASPDANAPWDMLLHGEDTFLGGSGNDVIASYGYSGSDRLYGGDGSDVLILRRGSFDDSITVDGGAGIDTLGVTTGSHLPRVIESIDAIDFLNDGASLQIRSGMLKAFGLSPAAHIKGSTDSENGVESNIIRIVPESGKLIDLQYWTFEEWGGKEQYILIEVESRTELNAYGSEEIDKIWGGRQSDTIADAMVTTSSMGGAGNDWLRGDMGKDALSGGSGKDSFVFFEVAGGADVISDFSSKDSFVLVRTSFKKIGKKLESDEFRVGKAKDANDFIIYDKKHGELIYDHNGNGRGAGLLIASIKNKSKIDYDDFSTIPLSDIYA